MSGHGGRWMAVWAAMLLVAGCAPPETDQVVLAVGGAPAELEVWEELAAEFGRTREIRVELLRQPTDTDLRRQSLLIPLRAGRPDPDVMLLDVAWLAQFAASGWLADLESRIHEGGFDLEPFFAPVLARADRWEGRLIALPVYVDAGLLYYRTDLLRKYGLNGPPATWSELLAQARIAQAGERGEGFPILRFRLAGRPVRRPGL